MSAYKKHEKKQHKRVDATQKREDPRYVRIVGALVVLVFVGAIVSLGHHTEELTRLANQVAFAPWNPPQHLHIWAYRLAWLIGRLSGLSLLVSAVIFVTVAAAFSDMIFIDRSLFEDKVRAKAIFRAFKLGLLIMLGAIVVAVGAGYIAIRLGAA